MQLLQDQGKIYSIHVNIIKIKQINFKVNWTLFTVCNTSPKN